MKRRIYIKEIGIELVHGCNLRCRMCPIIKISPSEYMSIDQLKRILDNLKFIKYRKRLFLVGRGETLLHPEIEKIFLLLEHEKIYNKFKYRYIYTNATVLTPEIIRILCNYNVVNELVFSLHGHGDEQTYEYWCGKNNWEKVITGISSFIKFYKDNKKYDINYKISVIIPDYTLVPFVSVPQDKIIRNFQDVFGKDMLISFRSIHDYDGQNEIFPGKRYIKSNCYRLLEGDWNFKVNGDIVPCCAVANPSLTSIIGNINKNSIQEIYGGEKFQNIRRLLNTNHRDKLEMCKKCTLLSSPEKINTLFIKVKHKLSSLKLRLKSSLPVEVKKSLKNVFRKKNIKGEDRLKYISKLKSQIAKEPLNEQLHLQLGQAYTTIGYIDHAIACFRTANYLGAMIDYSLITKKVPDLFELPVDQYIRFKTVADSINDRYRNASVLDVGGGHGFLGYFLPKQRYILADIRENGITAIPLPFKDNDIDIVCTTDTLEHVPRNLRDKFIYEIIRVAKNEIHIVVPTMLPAKYPDYNLYFYKMTGAFQTKEHIEYGVPTVEELYLLLEPYKDLISYEIMPCGSLINIALLLHYYLIAPDKHSLLVEMCSYFNKFFYNEIKNGPLPVSHYIKIEKRKQSKSHENNSAF